MEAHFRFRDLREERERKQLHSLLITLVCFICFGIISLCSGCLQPCRAEVDLSIIKQIESNGNPLAYNPHSKARGLYQITEICLKDYNQQNNAKISPTMLFDPKVNEMVAKWYLGARIPQFLQNKGIPITDANVIWAYNSGIGNVVKGRLPLETKNYLIKYNRLVRR